MRRLLILFAIALPMTGCISLDSVRYVGPYYRTPTGVWAKADGRSGAPEALLPCPGSVCRVPVSAGGGRSGTGGEPEG